MKIGIIGTGVVGQTIGTKLVQHGHEVKMGSRTANNEKAIKWVNEAGKNASQGTFADAAAFGEIVFNCTKGEVTTEALKAAGANNLKGKILIDVANPLDFSKGMPPILTPSLSNTNSLGEEVQKTFPDAKVVKAFNTMNCKLMVNPQLVPGNHNLFICGNDTDAKAKITSILEKDFGWPQSSFIDMGDITSSRAMEALLPIWIRLMVKFGNPNFNFSIAKA
jgi:predicted dinucleotide-binding enzyme